MSITTAVPVSLGEKSSWRRQFCRDVLQGLSHPQKTLPCKYFYDDRGSALFDRICELDEYYLTRSETAILRTSAREMADAIGPDCELIELGSGSAIKTRLLLEALHSPRAYVPVDISQQPLSQSARELSARFPTLRVVPVHADFTDVITLPDTGLPRARRVVFFPGSTIGNFDPEAAKGLFQAIRRMVGDGGGLLIGFDLDKDPAVVWPAYNDQSGVTAAFNLNLLVRINRELGANFDLNDFEHRADYIRDAERVEMHLVSRKAQSVCIAGHDVAFSERESIHTESSYKYSRSRFASLTEPAGFRLEHQWLDPQAYFCIQFLMAV